MEINEKPAHTGIITAVTKSVDYFDIKMDDGWHIGLEACNPGGVAPETGQRIELFGKGLGYAVRGIRIAGRMAFYRTEWEHRLHADRSAYGCDAAELLGRWDAGKSVWSVAMGGFGPGYEQALQIAAFEALRILVAGGDLNNDTFLANKRVQALGLSGSQGGAAISLARAFMTKGPIETIKGVADDRRIQVSANPPTVQALDRAIAEANTP